MSEMGVALTDENLQAGGMDAAGFKDHVLALGEAQGTVDFADILDVMPELDKDTELLQELFSTLIERGVENH